MQSESARVRKETVNNKKLRRERKSDNTVKWRDGYFSFLSRRAVYVTATSSIHVRLREGSYLRSHVDLFFIENGIPY